MFERVRGSFVVELFDDRRRFAGREIADNLCQLRRMHAREAVLL